MVRLTQCLYDEFIGCFQVYAVGLIFHEMTGEQIELTIRHDSQPFLLFQCSNPNP